MLVLSNSKHLLIMSKFDEAIELYKSEMTGKIGMKSIDEALLIKITKGLGPSIYKKDAAKVSSSDKTEMQRVKDNFLIKKLGLEEGPKLDKGIDAVIEKIGRSNRNKYRAIFYYLLVKHFRKSALYAD